jgi:hypothetical protein
MTIQSFVATHPSNPTLSKKDCIVYGLPDLVSPLAEHNLKLYAVEKQTVRCRRII